MRKRGEKERIKEQEVKELACKRCSIIPTTHSQTPRLCENPLLSFRRSIATEKSKQKPRFLPTVEMTSALFTQSVRLGTRIR